MKYRIKVWLDGTGNNPEFIAFDHTGSLDTFLNDQGRMVAAGGLITVVGDDGKRYSIPGRRIIRIETEEIR